MVRHGASLGELARGYILESEPTSARQYAQPVTFSDRVESLP